MIIDLKRNFITTSISRSPATDQQQTAFVLEAAKLGYVVPFEAFSLASSTSLKNALDEMIKFKGAAKDWTPMYPNFPRQVELASGWELFFNAFVHYGGIAFGVDIRPSYDVEIRGQLEILPEHLTTLKVVDEDELLTSEIKNLENKVSLSEDDFKRVEKAIRDYGVNRSLKLMKEFKFQNKENWIQSFKILLNLGAPRYDVEDVAYASAKTATDLLRVIFMLYSDGNVHIDLTVKNTPTHLKSIPRASRRKIVDTINDADFDLDDYFLHRKIWKIVDRKVHPGEYTDSVNALNVFAIVRGTTKHKTFNSRVESAIKSGDSDAITKILRTRPGVFARRLDHALRSVHTDGQKAIAVEFVRVADKISTPVLASVYNGISNRDNDASVVRTKSGQTANVVNVKAPVHPAVIGFIKAKILESLRNQYSDREAMGKVYVSPDLMDIAAPLQQRTVSTGRVLPRGSKIPMPVDETLRFFIHWYNQSEGYYDGRVDLDMDAIFLDDSLSSVDYVSFSRLRNSYARHSGDITNAPNPQGAAEFIDVNCSEARAHGVRYVVMNINSYSGQPFSTVENFVGYMIRTGDVQKGEIFDPKTVQSAFTITSPTRNSIPALFDIVEGKFIWLDTSFGQAGYGFSAYGSNEQLAETVKLELDKTTLSMYDVITANATARGTVVDKEDADVIFDLETLDVFDSNGFINKFL